MLDKDLDLVGVSVQIVISAATYHMRFVHSDVDDFCRIRGGDGREHSVYQFISPVFARKQYVRRVDNGRERRPANYSVNVCKRLNAWNEFHAALFCESVNFFDFGLRVSAAEIAEIRLFGNFIGVFGVKQNRIEPYLCADIYPLFKRVHIHDRIAGTVKHRSHAAKRRFVHFSFLSVQRSENRTLVCLD